MRSTRQHNAASSTQHATVWLTSARWRSALSLSLSRSLSLSLSPCLPPSFPVSVCLSLSTQVTVLKYRMRHVLQSWGFLPDQSTASQSAAAAKKRPAATPVATEKSGSVPAPVKRSKNG